MATNKKPDTSGIRWAYGSMANLDPALLLGAPPSPVTDPTDTQVDQGFADGDEATSMGLNYPLHLGAEWVTWFDRIAWSDDSGESWGYMAPNMTSSVNPTALNLGGQKLTLEDVGEAGRWRAQFDVYEPEMVFTVAKPPDDGIVAYFGRTMDLSRQSDVLDASTVYTAIRAIGFEEWFSTAVWIPELANWPVLYIASLLGFRLEVEAPTNPFGAPQNTLAAELGVLDKDGIFTGLVGPFSTTAAPPTSLAVNQVFNPAQETIPFQLDHGVPRGQTLAVRLTLTMTGAGAGPIASDLLGDFALKITEFAVDIRWISIF